MTDLRVHPGKDSSSTHAPHPTSCKFSRKEARTLGHEGRKFGKTLQGACAQFIPRCACSAPCCEGFIDHPARDCEAVPGETMFSGE